MLRSAGHGDDEEKSVTFAEDDVLWGEFKSVAQYADGADGCRLPDLL